MKTMIAMLLFVASAPALAAPIHYFRVTAPETVALDVPFVVTATAMDRNGAIAVDYVGTVYLDSTFAVRTYTFTKADEGTHDFLVTLHRPCSQIISVSDRTYSGSTSTFVAGTPPPDRPARYLVTVPEFVTRDVPSAIDISAVNVAGKPVGFSLWSLEITSTSQLTVLSFPPPGRHIALGTPGVQTVTVKDSDCRASGSAMTTVLPGDEPPVAYFSMDLEPGSVRKGEVVHAKVTARDTVGRRVAGYRRSVMISYNFPYTFTAEDAGSHTFDMIPTYRGPQSVGVMDEAARYISGTASLDVFCDGELTLSSSSPGCPGEAVVLIPNYSVYDVCWICYKGIAPADFTYDGCVDSRHGCQLPFPPVVSAPGVYSLMGYYDHCSSTATATVLYLDQIEIAVDRELEARGRSIASVPAMANVTYDWSITNGVIIEGERTNRIRFLAGDVGPVNLSVTMAKHVWSQCSVTKSTTVMVRATPATAYLPATLSVCGLGTITIPITLTGKPPFTLVWSDGVTQEGIATLTASRDVDVAAPLTLSIASIRDAAGEGGPSNPVALLVDTSAAIEEQPHDAGVMPGEKAAFSVVASGENLHYAWYSVAPPAPMQQVGTDAPTFTTSWPVTKPETYIVRVSNACGSVDSVQVTARPAVPRRRAAGGR